MGKGPPAILIHGLLVGNLATWYFSVAPKLSKSHRLMLYDLRGHGHSERVAHGYDLATMTQDLDGLANAFSREPLTLIGHSYGALIALKFALDKPERVARLVLIEAPLPPSELQEMQAFMNATEEDMLAALPTELQGLLKSGGRRARRFADSLRFLTLESSLLSDLRNTADLTDDELAQLRCPSLCIYGRQSSCVSVGRRLSRVLPNNRLKELDGGHFLPTEAAHEVTQLILDFVRG
jgi:pimeloyl-ACP methyl ester carboxylesterase